MWLAATLPSRAQLTNQPPSTMPTPVQASWCAAARHTHASRARASQSATVPSLAPLAPSGEPASSCGPPAQQSTAAGCAPG